MKVLVSGAGIGGLAAARALTADGHQVTVFERAPGLRQGGAAVTLWSNGTGVLADLGVSLAGSAPASDRGPAASDGRAGALIEALETRDHHGKLLVSVDVGQAAAHYGHPHVCLPRSRLLGLLAEGLPAGTVVFGRASAAAAETAAGVRLTFADGGSADGNLLVVADGRGSALRDQLWGGDPGRLTGWATWQGLSRLPGAIASSRSSVLFVGRPGTCGLMPAGDGLLQWWFDLRWAPGAPPPAKPVTLLRQQFGGWAPPVRAVLDAITDEETGFFPHYRHRVPRTWGRGPVTVIGDAAHSMPPTRAQGANQALEDAWALAAALRHAASRDADGVASGDADGAVSRDADDADGAADGKAAAEAALRAFERSRSKKAGLVSRQAGTEDYNRYGAVLSRLVPGPLATRYYTRWLRQVSSYLDTAARPAQ